MIRVAFYARFSSDLQKPTSIEDQLRLCRERAEREGWEIVGSYTDYGLTGTTLHNRDGLSALMLDARKGIFDMVLGEGLDRFSRDQEDIAGIYKRLQFMRVKMFTLIEGEITALHIGMKGTMNALFVTDLAGRVVRGQRGRVENGKIGGGNGYGYDVVKRFDEHGNPVRGERTINEEHAKVIQRIFGEYAAGKSPKAIAAQLNAECVPNPGRRGRKKWSQSTINGNWQRGSGILNNEMYVGVIAWNKVHYAKDPETGKHVARPNPESEWVRKEVPEFRIIDQEVWEQAKARQRRARNSTKGFWDKQRPKYLFSQRLKCGCCGGSFSKISKLRYGCAAVRNSGEAACSNRRVIFQDNLEHTVLQVLQRNLMEPKLVEVFCKEYTEHLNRLRMQHDASIHAYRAELEKLDRQERLIVKAVLEGFANEAMKHESHVIVARRQELQSLLANTRETPTLIHPTMAKRYHQEVTALVYALNDGNHRHEAVELIRSLIEKIVLSPDPDGPGLVIDVHGDLAGIINIATAQEGVKQKQEIDLKQIRMVVGLEPTTANSSLSKLVPRTSNQLGHELAAVNAVKLVPRKGLEPPRPCDH